MENKRSDVLEKVRAEINCVKELTDFKYQEIIGQERISKLKIMQKKLMAIESKLDSCSFEVSIVGLEKSGKSTFANAFMGIDLLPTKDARCTYTATRICYGVEDKANIKFYSADEFNEGFFSKISFMGIIDTDLPMEWNEWSKELLDSLVSKLSSISTDQKNVYNDLLEIIENKESLFGLLSKDYIEISGESMDVEVKDYIENPAYALAVKEIVIFSTRLSEMKNAIIYDVPGFDSPTQIHKDQTREWMRKSDAVVLIVNADRPSFNDSIVRFFETIDKDDDGISIGEKIFVFANRADVATTLEENISKIKNELLKYGIIESSLVDERVLVGSAKARIDIEAGKGEYILQELIKKGIGGDGIDDIRTSLSNYNDTTRVNVIHRRLNNIRNELQNYLLEIKDENQIQDDKSIEIEIDNIVDELKRESRLRINNELSEYRDYIEEQSRTKKTITQKVRECVISKINPDTYQITDEEIKKAKNAELMDTKTLITSEYKIRQGKYAEMYTAFINNVVDIAVEEYIDSENAIIEAFKKGLGITMSHPYYDELESAIKEYVKEKCTNSAPEGYYSSLLRRYSRNLFEILISSPFSEPSRYRIFDEERKNFYSLALFGSENESYTNPKNSPMHYQILFHEQIENTESDDDVDPKLSNIVILAEEKIREIIPVGTEIYELLEKFIEIYGDESEIQIRGILSEIKSTTERTDSGLPLFAITPNPLREQLIAGLKERIETRSYVEPTCISSEESYKDYFRSYNKNEELIKDEFRKDIIILKNILNEQVMNAVEIEIPFLDLVQQNIISLKESLDQSDFTTFINYRKEMILEEKFRKLSLDNERRKKQAEILSEIENIINFEEVTNNG